MNHRLYRETRKFIIAMGICLGAYALLSLCTSCSGEVRDDGDSTIKVNTFEYNNHKYIKFTEPYLPNRMGVVHDPECLKNDLKIE